MGVVRQLVRRAMVGVLPRQRFLVRGSPRCGAVVLTFDDGPHPRHTPELLDRLRSLGIPATFFLVERAERHPELVQRIVSDGHEIGHHSFTHGDPESTSAEVLADEIRATGAVFRSAGAADARLVRPPHGKLSAAKLAAIWGLDKAVVLWNVDPKDFSLPSGEALQHWAESWAPSGGDIVLLHDNHPWAAQALGALAGKVRSAGLGFRTVSALVNHAP